MMIFRFLSKRLPSSSSRRLVMITGARQTGKTTLAQLTYPDLQYISMDEIEERFRLRELPTRAWGTTIGAAILDEAQKEPSIFEKVKFAYDREDVNFSVLLGSSQIVMLKRIRETLAGRAFVYELWPLMLSEMASGASGREAPLLDRLIVESGQADDILTTESLALGGEEAYEVSESLDHGLSWGGMPELLELTPAERRDWLRSYTNTYLERDLSDLARIDDLAPFRRFLSLAALRSGQLLSYADLARDAAVSPGTARNYLNYLTLSYQTFLLQPYFGSRTKRRVKSPKLFWIDVGLFRQQTGYWGGISGPLFETFVVGECYKWIKTMRPEAEMWFYRTHGGLEVDLLITTSDGVWGIEVKASQQVNKSMFSSLRRLSSQIDSPWRGGLVVYLGDFLRQMGQDLWAIPAGRLFG